MLFLVKAVHIIRFLFHILLKLTEVDSGSKYSYTKDKAVNFFKLLITIIME